MTKPLSSGEKKKRVTVGGKPGFRTPAHVVEHFLVKGGGGGVMPLNIVFGPGGEPTPDGAKTAPQIGVPSIAREILLANIMTLNINGLMTFEQATELRALIKARC